MSDTDTAMLGHYLELIRDMPGPQRFIRALELSALVRSLAWQGANLQAGHHGAPAVAERFLVQMYGPGMARWVRARVPELGRL